MARFTSRWRSVAWIACILALYVYDVAGKEGREAISAGQMTIQEVEDALQVGGFSSKLMIMADWGPGVLRYQRP